MKIKVKIFILALVTVQLVFGVMLYSAAEASLTDPIKIESGLISGVSLNGGIRAYKGIPFAAPPIGYLRWESPHPAPPWGGTRKCMAYGSACPQPDMSKIAFLKFDKTSEDCLNLNIWTPAKSNKEKLPVMVWIHGGAFISGSASNDLYDGQHLAKKGVVVVTTNYRLGPFGFFAHPSLSKESPHGVSGNYGILDQIAALKWVRANIAAFGGNPDRVTIFGESGGGRSVALLLISPLSKGLFHGAIMQSSSVYRPTQHLREIWYARPGMEEVGEEVTKALGCDKAKDPIAAMRAKSASEILVAAPPRLPGMGLGSSKSTQKGFVYEPVADGWLLPDEPSDLFDAGKQHKVPVIAGSNSDEGTLFLMKMRFISRWKYRRIIKSSFSKNADEILERYPFNSSDDAREALNKISGDLNCAAPMRSIVRNMEKVKAKAWLYYFTHVRNDKLGKKLGAWHGSEIRFVFNSLDQGRSLVEDRDRHLSKIMSDYWVNFAATGDPNGPGLPKWPPYNRATGYYIEFGDQVHAKQYLRKKSLNMSEKIEAYRRANRRKTPK